MEVDLDGESDLDVTEVGHVLPATQKIQTAGTRAGAGGVAEGASPASSVSSRRDDNDISSITDSNSSSSGSNSSRSSSSNTGNGDDKSGSSTSSGDIPELTGGEAHEQKWNGKIHALQGGRTWSQSR